ncbi:hypothetical protein VHA_002566 [Grimontia hollisae CIP 101886]|uniref:Uncharacterized protein n=1 Tax=Grimontia hollisae CIP 101886 TaxID=675812 RepID=D0I9Z1_GRIHO|nr:hypothetical protein VHA_002566 [Grimontia hollisae CIP 101886]STQ75476.1 Uncharacterised protein [Grimontia hollisae]
MSITGGCISQQIRVFKRVTDLVIRQYFKNFTGKKVKTF